MLAALFAGRFAAPGCSVLDVARQVSARSEPALTASDLLLDGLAANFLQGYTASVPILRRALNAFVGDMRADQELRGMPEAPLVALHLWDDVACEVLFGRWSTDCRKAGALSELPIALNGQALIRVLAGDLSGAASLVEEVRAATDATGLEPGAFGAMALAAFRGDQAEASPLIEASTSEALVRGEGIVLATQRVASRRGPG